MKMPEKLKGKAKYMGIFGTPIAPMYAVAGTIIVALGYGIMTKIAHMNVKISERHYARYVNEQTFNTFRKEHRPTGISKLNYWAMRDYEKTIDTTTQERLRVMLETDPSEFLLLYTKSNL